MDAKVGPDGALYVIDMYRGILQHVRYVTTYLREYILEHGLDRPIGMGRIYRVVWEGEGEEPAPIRRDSPKLESAADRIAALSHSNGWHRDAAQRLLVEGELGDAGRGSLRELARSGDNSLARIHALWTLHGRGDLDAATALAAVREREAWLVVHGLRAGEELLASSSAGQAAIAELVDSSSPQVRTQALLTLGAAARRDPWARIALADRLASGPDDPFHRQVALAANLQGDGGGASPEAPARVPAAPALTADEAAQFNSGRRHYRACSSCHNDDGRGQDGLGPSLVDSPWVLGSPERLAALVLQGLEGPIEVHGETWDDMMPGFAVDPRLPDPAIAALLTYVRRSWGNTAAPVPTETVTRVREATAERRDPWTAAELEAAFD